MGAKVKEKARRAVAGARQLKTLPRREVAHWLLRRSAKEEQPGIPRLHVGSLVSSLVESYLGEKRTGLKTGCASMCTSLTLQGTTIWHLSPTPVFSERSGLQ